jgi:hypothetical protein
MCACLVSRLRSLVARIFVTFNLIWIALWLLDAVIEISGREPDWEIEHISWNY